MNDQLNDAMSPANVRGPRSIMSWLMGGALVVAGIALYVVPRLTGLRAVELADVAEPGDAKGLNVVLVTLDTTRADHLGCYGYSRNVSPHIDALMEHGVRFDHAFTAVPVTLPAHTTIMTGRYPYHHGVRNNGTYEVPKSERTLAEVLRDQGYATAAFVSAFVLDKRYGINQGFDTYDFEVSAEGQRMVRSLACEREAHHVTTAAIEWLQQRQRTDSKRPFFMWVHYYDPHSPYRSPLIDEEANESMPLVDRYDAEINFMDLHFGRLVDAMKKQGIFENTLLVMVADHGEMLGEHGETEHGGFIYESAMHVGLVFASPALFDAGYRVNDQVVATADILPTTLSLLGIEPPDSLDGVDLLTAAADPDRAVYIETKYTMESMGAAPLYGLRRLRDKFIHAPLPEYYDLEEDPEEQRNLFGRDDPQIVELQSRLTKIMEEFSEAPEAARTISPDEVARLRALGYAAGSQDVDEASLPDPKKQVPILAGVGEARSLSAAGRNEEALEIALDVLDQTECVTPAALAVGEIYNAMGRREEAVAALAEFVRSCPSTEMLILLAELSFTMDRYDDMNKYLTDAETMDAREGSIPMLRGDYAAKMGDYAAAIAFYRKALEIDELRVGPKVREKLAEVARLREANSP